MSRQTVGAGDRQRSIGYGQRHVVVTRVRLNGQEARPERPTLSSVTPTGQLVRACCATLFSATRRRVKAVYKNTSASPYVRLRVYTDSYRMHQTENPVELLARDTTPRRDARARAEWSTDNRFRSVIDTYTTRLRPGRVHRPPLFEINLITLKFNHFATHLNRPPPVVRRPCWRDARPSAFSLGLPRGNSARRIRNRIIVRDRTKRALKK